MTVAFLFCSFSLSMCLALLVVTVSPAGSRSRVLAELVQRPSSSGTTDGSRCRASRSFFFALACSATPHTFQRPTKQPTSCCTPLTVRVRGRLTLTLTLTLTQPAHELLYA